MNIAYIQDPRKRDDLEQIRSFFLDYSREEPWSDTFVSEVPDFDGSVDAVLRVDTALMDFAGKTRVGFLDVLDKIDGLEVEHAGSDHIILRLTVKDVWKRVAL
ncbi:hypothetical protein [Pseudoflavonifractor sp. MSJ-37]|uniref:hypothetical protein n=1 Tax=Pseudoflavonifractor sp. MSJ-37 TaxID=2841531 RepID=UPI001C11ED92|nr:hypothetical protein [Pseudoflavonifractor sp. MSJ-37]MBU5434610.1 hypothetical protein [Pseudoflavonifractor sp. MSJ-37]